MHFWKAHRSFSHQGLQGLEGHKSTLSTQTLSRLEFPLHSDRKGTQSNKWMKATSQLVHGSKMGSVWLIFSGLLFPRYNIIVKLRCTNCERTYLSSTRHNLLIHGPKIHVNEDWPRINTFFIFASLDEWRSPSTLKKKNKHANSQKIFWRALRSGLGAVGNES